MSHILTAYLPAPASAFQYLLDSLYRLLGIQSAMSRGRPNLENYDIDGATGFFPPQPLKRLEGVFELWERALDEGERVLSLGSDGSTEARANYAKGETWRAQIRTVSFRIY